MNINLTSTGQTAHCPRKVFHAILCRPFYVLARVEAKSERSRFFQPFSHGRPCYVNIILTTGGQMTHCSGKIFYMMLRVPIHHRFTEFERFLRGRDFLLLALGDCLARHQTIRCLAKCYYTLNVGFMCSYITRLE